MSFTQAITLAILQGITEFLPISSSGHLVLAQKLFHLAEVPVFFTILVHSATLSAVFFYFRREIIHLPKNFLAPIVIASLPTAFIGLLLNPYTKTLFNSLFLVAGGLIITSLLLVSSKYIKTQSFKKKITPSQAFIIGLFQSLAILPGVSRSGATIIAGLWLGLNQNQAFTFSFLLSIPAIIGAQLLQLREFNLNQSTAKTPFVFGFFIAVITGFAALKILHLTLKQKKLYLFANYTFFLAFFTILLVKLLGK